MKDILRHMNILTNNYVYLIFYASNDCLRRTHTDSVDDSGADSPMGQHFS